MSADRIVLDESAVSVWRLLRDTGALEFEALVTRTGLPQAQIAVIARAGAEAGFLGAMERNREEVVAAPGALDRLGDELPERRAVREIAAAGGEMDAAVLARWAAGAGLAVNEVLRWGQARGWLRREKEFGGKRVLVLVTDAGRGALDTPDADELALRLTSGSPLYLDELGARGVDADRVRELLGHRPELARIKPRVQRTLALTAAGAAALDRGIVVRQEKNALTAEDLQSGSWKQISLRAYDVTLPAGDRFPAKIHPLRRIIEETRHAFLEMGFTEVASPMVESAFWNFDALFQPQDHPARDMQDTFYMAHPDRAALPPDEVVARVQRTHEDGWETGSEGWGYRWDAEQARRVVLRTHTTAATIRALAAHPQPPLKVFCVGWTYRNETVSYKHLPVFHQVDGVVVDTQANLATLLGTLREFYRKMGFDQVRFKPAFYPYTEPSADVVVYMRSRDRWIEMGGSGIFRPEVTRPFGCRHAVLAWGLGIERLAMLRLGFESIRELYESSLDRLEQVPLCR